MLDNRTKEEQVADYLRERIISGEIVRGARLKQADIANQLNLSITPVREALKILEAEGYVKRDSYKGAQVAPKEPIAEEILQLRLVLEVRLVQGALHRITDEDLLVLKQLSEDFASAFQAGDRAGARGINYRFHRTLYELADMPQTLHFVQVLWARYPFDDINAVTGRGDDAAREHDAILAAFASRDLTAAVMAMRQHIESGWAAIQPEALL